MSESAIAEASEVDVKQNEGEASAKGPTKPVKSSTWSKSTEDKKPPYSLEETTNNLSVVIKDRNLATWLYSNGCESSIPFRALHFWTGDIRANLEILGNEAMENELSERDCPKNVKAFLSWLKKAFASVEGKYQEKLAQGMITLSGAKKFFLKGSLVTFKDDRGQIRSMRIKETSIRSGWTGVFFTIEGSVLTHDGQKFIHGHEKLSIPAWEGYKDITTIPFHNSTDEEIQALAKRGRRWVDVNLRPTHLAYKGEVIRKKWIFTSKFGATGRVMVDIHGMKQADPDYDCYCGVDRYHDDEDVTFTPENITNLEDTILATAIPYVYGFSFRCKKWGEMLIDDCSEIEFRKDAFEKLVLDSQTKNLLFDLVDGSDLGHGSDFVDGKGGGLIFLLHGAPGVGKTFTAEAISEKQGRPLYMISVGEIGTNAVDVETSLREILETAQRWNAVLLLDECDIFLERRKEDDMERNAVVSVFLRMIEYHQGILFMTTNRVKDLDPAFYSRISLPIHYNSLSNEGRQSVWFNHLVSNGVDQAQASFLSAQLNDLNVNGRQIKNVVNIAKAISNKEGVEVSMEKLLEVANYLDKFSKESRD